MKFLHQHIISIRDLSKEDLIYLVDLGERIHKHPGKEKLLHGKILSNIFYEPSTRTRLSFESAMLKLGGSISGFSDPDTSSVMKGERLTDTMKIVSGFSDIIVLRHPVEGAARFVAEDSHVPIINAGDGANQHPTQTLLDLFTIKKAFSTLDNLHIALVGDLKHGRTVHSLCMALLHFNVRFTFCSLPQLGIPQDTLSNMQARGISCEQTSDISATLNADIIYMTRIQKERFSDEMEYEKVRGHYILSKDMLAGSRVRIMHPLPRVDEISTDIDDTEHNLYFEQARNGVVMRQAILALLLGALE